jgi:catechol 2,3-dioxygenase
MSMNHFMSGTHVTKIELSVQNLARSLEYYQHDLGFHLLEKTEQTAELGTAEGVKLLCLVERPTAIRKKRQAGMYHFAILLPTRMHLGMFLHHLIQRQVPVTGSADHGVSEAFYLEDPDQNGIEVYADKDYTHWYDEFQQMNMVTKELDYPGLYYEVEGDDSYLGLPNGSIVGHLHLYVSNLEASLRFYHEVLGFQLMVDTFPNALFLSDKQYHHHIAINTWLGKNIAPRDLTTLGMESFTLGFAKCEDVAKVLLRLKEFGYQIIETDSGYDTFDPDNNPIHLRLIA